MHDKSPESGVTVEKFLKKKLRGNCNGAACHRRTGEKLAQGRQLIRLQIEWIAFSLQVQLQTVVRDGWHETHKPKTTFPQTKRLKIQNFSISNLSTDKRQFLEFIHHFSRKFTASRRQYHDNFKFLENNTTIPANLYGIWHDPRTRNARKNTLKKSLNVRRCEIFGRFVDGRLILAQNKFQFGVLRCVCFRLLVFSTEPMWRVSVNSIVQLEISRKAGKIFTSLKFKRKLKFFYFLISF